MRSLLELIATLTCLAGALVIDLAHNGTNGAQWGRTAPTERLP